MTSLESLVTLSCDLNAFGSSLSQNHKESTRKASSFAKNGPSADLISRLIKLTLPLELSTIYSRKRQELLYSLLGYYPSLDLPTKKKIDGHIVNYLRNIKNSLIAKDNNNQSTPKDNNLIENADHTAICFDSCESGFFHRFLKEYFLLFSSSSEKHFSTVNKCITLVIEIFQIELRLLKEAREEKKKSKRIVSERSSVEEEKDSLNQRNHFLVIQEVLHLIGTTAPPSPHHQGKGAISWLLAGELVAEVSRLSVKSLQLDSEFACSYMLKLMMAMRTILTELLQSSPNNNIMQNKSSLALSLYRESVESFFEAAQSLLLEKEKQFFKKTLEEVALVILMLSSQLMQDNSNKKSIVFVSQSFLSYWQFFGQQGMIDGLLALLQHRHSIHYDIHLTVNDNENERKGYSSYLSEIEAEDSSLSYYQLVEAERLLSLLVETMMSHIVSESEEIIQALHILSTFLTRQLGCLFEMIEIDLKLPSPKKADNNASNSNSNNNSAPDIISLTRKIFQHIVNILTMQGTIQTHCKSPHFLSLANSMLGSTVMNQSQSHQQSVRVTAVSSFDQLIYYLRDKLSLLLQAMSNNRNNHNNHNNAAGLSFATSSYSGSERGGVSLKFSQHPDKVIILSILHLLLFTELSVISSTNHTSFLAIQQQENHDDEDSDTGNDNDHKIKMKTKKTANDSLSSFHRFWLLQELTHLSDQAISTSFPPLTAFINDLHCQLLLDYYSENNNNISSWKKAFVQLLDYLWMKVDVLVGKIFSEMEGDSVFSASSVAHLIRSFESYCSSLAQLIQVAIDLLLHMNNSQSNSHTNNSYGDYEVFGEIDKYFIPFINTWLCFILRCLSCYDNSSPSSSNRLFMTYRNNSVLAVTENCFIIFQSIFQYESIRSSFTNSLNYDQISIKAIPLWKWVFRFWLLVSVCEMKFGDHWRHRITLQSSIRSFSQYTMPLFIGLKTLAESSSIDIMSEYIANDKEILSILSVCSKGEIAAFCIRCAAVMTPASFDVYFAVIYELEMKRIRFKVDFLPSLVLYLESLYWPSSEKRRIAESIFSELRRIWIEEVKAMLLQGQSHHNDSNDDNNGNNDENASSDRREFEEHLSRQLNGLLQYCFDVRKEVRKYCQTALLALLPFLTSSFLLHPNRLNLLHRLLSSSFHLEALYEDTLARDKGQRATSMSLSVTAPLSERIADTLRLITINTSQQSSQSLLSLSLPNVVYPVDAACLLEVLSVTFSLLYSILRDNQQLSELLKRDQLKDFLSTHIDHLNETILLVQEYLNQRIQITLLNEAATMVHTIRRKIASTHYHHNNAKKDVNLVYPETGPSPNKSIESILFVRQEAMMIVENSVAQSLFATRSSLRKQLQQTLTSNRKRRKHSSTATATAMEDQRLYELIVTYRTIIFHHHHTTSNTSSNYTSSSSASSTILDKKDFLLYLQASAVYLVEDCCNMKYFEEVIDSIERLLLHFPPYRTMALAILLPALQSSLITAGFHFACSSDKDQDSDRVLRGRQDFWRIVEFLRRMLSIRDPAVSEMIRQFTHSLLRQSMHHFSSSSITPSALSRSVLSSYSNCYAITVLALTISQHCATSALTRDPLEQSEESNSKGRDYSITARHLSILREDSLRWLLSLLETQLQRGDSLIDSSLAIQQQYLLETMHYLAIDSRRWRLEQTPLHPDSELIMPGYQTNIRNNGGMADEEERSLADMAAMRSILPRELFSLPLTTAAKFHHSRPIPANSSSVVLTLIERAESASLCGRHFTHNNREVGDNDHSELPTIEQWKEVIEARQKNNKKTNNSTGGGMRDLLMLLFSHIIDRYQATATHTLSSHTSHTHSSSSSNSSSSMMTRGMKFQLPVFSPSTFTAIHSNLSLYLSSMRCAWTLSPHTTAVLHLLSLDTAAQEEKKTLLAVNNKIGKASSLASESLESLSGLSQLSCYSGFLSFAVNHYHHFHWTSEYFSGLTELLQQQQNQPDLALEVFSCLQATSRLSEIFSILARCDSFSKQSTTLTTNNPPPLALTQLPQIIGYFIRSISQMPLSEVSFYLPQLVQSLRQDNSSYLTANLILLASQSPQLCHQISWLLQTESKQHMKKNNRYGFCFELEGVDPLPAIARGLISDINSQLSDLDRRFLVNEMAFFDAVTHISALLKEIKDKEQHPRYIRSYLKELRISQSEGLYMPTNPMRRVIGIDYESAAAMQSAAKCPFLLRFITEEWEGPDQYLHSLLVNNTSSSTNSQSERRRARGGREKDLSVMDGDKGDVTSVTISSDNTSTALTATTDKKKPPQQQQPQSSQKNSNNNPSVYFADDRHNHSSPSEEENEEEERLRTPQKKKNRANKIDRKASLLASSSQSGDDDDNNSDNDKREIRTRIIRKQPTTITTPFKKERDTATPAKQNSNNSNIVEEGEEEENEGKKETVAVTVFRTPKSSNNNQSINTINKASDNNSHHQMNNKSNKKGKSNKAVASVVLLSDACIFKVFDDCRQDILTLQVIRLLKQYYESINLPVHLSPYSIVSNRTGDNAAIGGILQVIPNVRSRDQLGKAGFKTLKQYYLSEFGPATSFPYQNAVNAFIASLAASNIVSYLMHIKDRHNGNILIDTSGHLIHIDFGFILGISPGGNLGFETAAFKFSQEMLDLIGGEESEGFASLQALTVQAFLAARQIKESILALVNAFADSDLPCFQHRKDTLERLYFKFFPAISESEAGDKMVSLLRDAMRNPTTAMYDGIQKLQNNIYSAEWK